MDGQFSDSLRLLKNGQKPDSFVAHFKQHFNSTNSSTDLRKYTMSKIIKQLNPIGTMKKIAKSNCNLFMEMCLTILKKLREKCATVMNKDLEIYGACRNKTTFHLFCLITNDTFKRVKGVSITTFFKPDGLKTSKVLLVLETF